MISEFEKFHGVVLRSIIVSAPNAVSIQKFDTFGRVNSYLINAETAIYLKHSAKRLPPWLFTFTPEQLLEIANLKEEGRSLWLILVCGLDGIVALSTLEFAEVIGDYSAVAPFIRIDRERGTMYKVYGNAGRLRVAKPNGVAAVVQNACALENQHGLVI